MRRQSAVKLRMRNSSRKVPSVLYGGYNGGRYYGNRGQCDGIRPHEYRNFISSRPIYYTKKESRDEIPITVSTLLKEGYIKQDEYDKITGYLDSDIFRELGKQIRDYKIEKFKRWRINVNKCKKFKKRRRNHGHN